MEICGTYSQFSGNYPAVDYAGDMDHVAYFITKAPASGVGSSILSGDEETTWIAIGQLQTSTRVMLPTAGQTLHRINATYGHLGYQPNIIIALMPKIIET